MQNDSFKTLMETNKAISNAVDLNLNKAQLDELNKQKE